VGIECGESLWGTAVCAVGDCVAGAIEVGEKEVCGRLGCCVRAVGGGVLLSRVEVEV